MDATLSKITLSLYIHLYASKQPVSSTTERTPLRKDEVLPGHPLVDDILRLDVPPFSEILDTNSAYSRPAWDNEGKVLSFIEDCEKLDMVTLYL